MDLEKQLTTALSNSPLIFSSEFPDTPDTISVAAILMYGKSNSCKEKKTFISIKQLLHWNADATHTNILGDHDHHHLLLQSGSSFRGFFMASAFFHEQFIAPFSPKFCF